MMMAEVTAEEHFPSFEDRVRSSRRIGRPASPCQSAHGVLYRTTLMKQQSKRASKVRFYRNGDGFFKGMIYAVSAERFRTFESLLADLTRSPICEKNIMPNGVRVIFSVDGARKISSLDDLKDGESYVCASTNFFKKINYPRSKDPSWNVNHSYQKFSQTEVGYRSGYTDLEENKEFIKPKLVTVIRNGARPRKAVRVLLNRKTAHSFEQVMSDITWALDSGTIRKVYTMDGRQVTRLQDFFTEETFFLAYGGEKYSLDDFDLDDNEVRSVGAYSSVRTPRERIALKSPKPPRRMSSDSSRSFDDVKSPKTGRRVKSVNVHSRVCPVSPRTPRKMTAAQPPANAKYMNGHSNGHTNGTADVKSAPTGLTSRYTIGKVIGEGNFAVVKLCVHKKQKREFALKIINKAKCKGKEQMIENEVSILRRVKHVNIIQLLEDFDASSELYLVMELVRGGDLFDAITSATKYTERDASGMLYNLMSAIEYLHSMNIVHRDIKPENLLVCEHDDGSRSLKLGDFGLATEVTEPLFVVCGTPTYVAPEVIAESGYGVKIDIWAAGVITYILLSGFPPFVSPTNDQDDLFDRIIEGKFEFISPFWDEVSESAKELIGSMLCVDVDDRFTAEEVLKHPWVAEDSAKDEDLHAVVSVKLDKNFTRKSKHPEQEAGVSLIACTALDKASRFFQGRKQVPLQEYSPTSEEAVENEVF